MVSRKEVIDAINELLAAVRKYREAIHAGTRNLRPYREAVEKAQEHLQNQEHPQNTDKRMGGSQ